jgi:hypothetical protein
VKADGGEHAAPTPAEAPEAPEAPEEAPAAPSA